MLTEKVIKGAQIAVPDVIEFEDLSGNIVVAGNKRDDYMPALSEQIVSENLILGYTRKMQTSGWTPNL